MSIGDPNFTSTNITASTTNVCGDISVNGLTTTSGGFFDLDPHITTTGTTIDLGVTTTIATGTTTTITNVTGDNITFQAGGSGWIMDPKQSLENAIRLALAEKGMSEKKLKEMAGRMIEEILAEEIVDI